MRKLLLILVLCVGCTPTLKYNDEVNIVYGFYEGETGTTKARHKNGYYSVRLNSEDKKTVTVYRFHMEKVNKEVQAESTEF